MYIKPRVGYNPHCYLTAIPFYKVVLKILVKLYTWCKLNYAFHVQHSKIRQKCCICWPVMINYMFHKPVIIIANNSLAKHAHSHIRQWWPWGCWRNLSNTDCWYTNAALWGLGNKGIKGHNSTKIWWNWVTKRVVWFET